MGEAWLRLYSFRDLVAIRVADVLRQAGIDVRHLPPQTPAGPEPMAPLLDKRALAHALCVSTATVDRLCRQQRIGFVRLGGVHLLSRGSRK